MQISLAYIVDWILFEPKENTVDFDKIDLIWANCVKLALNYETLQFIWNAFLVSNLSIQKAILVSHEFLFQFAILLKCMYTF